MTALAQGVAMRPSQGESRLRVVKAFGIEARRLPIRCAVASRAVVAEASLVFVHVAGCAG